MAKIISKHIRILQIKISTKSQIDFSNLKIHFIEVIKTVISQSINKKKNKKSQKLELKKLSLIKIALIIRKVNLKYK